MAKNIQIPVKEKKETDDDIFANNPKEEADIRMRKEAAKFLLDEEDKLEKSYEVAKFLLDEKDKLFKKKYEVAKDFFFSKKTSNKKDEQQDKISRYCGLNLNRSYRSIG